MKHQNPYLFIPKSQESAEKPKSISRSLASRDPIPPADDRLASQRYFRRHPLQFAQSVLGIHPWSKQVEILNAIANHRRVAVRSCNGAGKTYTAAIAVLWWIASFDDAIVITTAPSERQVRELLWREIHRIYIPRHKRIGGKLTRTRLDFTASRYAYGFSTNTIERFQGFHSGNILVIVDEASGVDEYIYDAITGVITSRNSKLLLIGNPLSFAGTFYDAFHKNRTRFKTIVVSAFDIPTFKERGLTAENIHTAEYTPDDNEAIDPDDTEEEQETRQSPEAPPGLSTPEWAIETFNLHGPQSSVYQQRVLGQFAEEADDTLIPLRNVEEAIMRQVDVLKDQPITLGVDIARFGNDKTVIIVRQGPKVLYIEEIRKSDLTNTSGRIISIAKSFKAKTVIIDEIGIGAGVVDNLRNQKNLSVIGFNSGFRAQNPESYLNLRSEAFDGIRSRFETGDIAIPNDPELVSQLASLTYKYNARGQLQLESKENIRSKGRQSPDKADALAIAFSAEILTNREQSVMVASRNNLRRLRSARRKSRRFRIN